MIHYRGFRNTDPPGLVSLWNEACTGRGAVELRSATLLEFFIFAKPYFDPAGLTLALDDEAIVGFAHSGFAANEQQTALDTSTGIICVLGVRPQYRRRGIAAELLRRSEQYLLGRGARRLVAGSRSPANPFYYGLLGGSDSPGLLTGAEGVEELLLRHGYAPADATLVMQRSLPRQTLSVVDPRFVSLRGRYQMQDLPRPGGSSWWQECVLGPVELLDFSLVDKTSHEPVATLGVWEMQGFSQRWGQASIGIKDLSVRPELRRKAIARFLVVSVLKRAQEQFFSLVEVQVAQENTAAAALFRGLGFEQVDVGRTWSKKVD